MRPATLLAGLIMVATGIAAAAQHTTLELTQITARGRALYAYDAAAAGATNAVLAMRQCRPQTQGARAPWDISIGHPTFSGWVFDFGSPSADHSTFNVLCQVTQAGPGSATFDVTFPNAPVDTPFDVDAARSILLAEADFRFVESRHSYDYAALQRQDGEWYIYLYPGSLQIHDHQVGGDGRYLISADGMQILERHPMHDAVVESTAPAPAVPVGGQILAGFHTDELDDVPQDTDVFHVLIRRPSMPEYVDARGHLYKIDIDGSIEEVGECQTHTPRLPCAGP